MKSQEELKDAAVRAFELLEQKSPHQLAVELVSMEDRVQGAIDACARMQEQRDQLAFQLKDATSQCAVAADLLRELREGAEIHLHNCIVCKNEQGIANWTSKLERIDALLAGQAPEPVYYMRDNHTFKRLSNDVDTAITEIEAELDAGWTSGMLCSKRKGFSSLHANYRRPREEFISDCRDAMLAAAPMPEGGA